jgi:hypothetical protein
LQISSANGPFFYGAGQQGIWGVNAYYGSGGWTYGGTGYATYYEQSSNGVHNWRIAASGTAGNPITFTQAMTLDASSNLLLGTTTARNRLTVQGTIYSVPTLGTASGNAFFGEASGSGLMMGTSGFGYGWIQQQRVDGTATAYDLLLQPSGGNLLVGTTSTGIANRVGIDYTGAVWGVVARNTSTSGGAYGIRSQYISQTPNNTNNYFFFADDATLSRFYVFSNGGIANFSANNTNLSDGRLKKDIQLAGSYLQKICAIPVKTFLYNDQTDNETNLGVIAQDVEAVAPELVNRGGWANEAPEGEEPYKSIYQTDLQYALMKCIQEQQAIIETLMADVATLKGN